MQLIPVILSGGVGSRLWPVSREAHPKPFMTLPDGQNLIQKTFLRAAQLDAVVEVLTVTNRELLFKTEDEYHAVNKGGLPLGYILEPFGRNTAAAVAAAAVLFRAAPERRRRAKDEGGYGDLLQFVRPDGASLRRAAHPPVAQWRDFPARPSKG